MAGTWTPLPFTIAIQNTRHNSHSKSETHVASVIVLRIKWHFTTQNATQVATMSLNMAWPMFVT
jgi:hypothetical protein